MKPHFSHSRRFQQYKSNIACLSIISFLLGGICLLYNPPTFVSFQKIVWLNEGELFTKFFIGVGIILMAVKFLLEAISKRNYDDWSLVYPILKPSDIIDQFVNNDPKVKRDKKNNDLIEYDNNLNGFLQNDNAVNTLGQKILKLKSEIERLN